MAGNSGEEKIAITQRLNNIFGEAISEGASDIHIEPLKDKIRIRFRVDGKLREKSTIPLYEFDQIVNRIKVLGELDLATRPTPQEGHFELIETYLRKEAGKDKQSSHGLLPQKLLKFFLKGREEVKEDVQAAKKDSEDASGTRKNGERIIDVRVSVFPTKHGEAVVLRLLNRAEMLMSFEDFELSDEAREKLRTLISKNYGMLLVTGPAGSGKTSMLYSILRELKSSEKNIVTLEDPVEYDLGDIRQTNIKPEQGLTFAMGMRSILRQDPDIIMIGEIRDPETAEHAIRASLMGRAVFSSVHSNSSVGIIARLVDMGVERSIMAYALNGSVSKRLVRRVCASCRVEYAPDNRHLKYFNLKKDSFHFVKGKGCEECGNTGYKSRVGIFEVMEIDDGMRSLIIEKAPMTAFQQYLETQTDMKTLKKDALEKVASGQTTLEEIVGVI